MKFTATLEIIGINPFVFVPPKILQTIFKASNKDRGPIPVSGTVNGLPFKQTLVKYGGAWRLYINTVMLKNSPKRIGEKINVAIAYDPIVREIPMHTKLKSALKLNPDAFKVFQSLPPSRSKEIARYISNLKSEEAIERNVARAIEFLNGKARFIGRDKP